MNIHFKLSSAMLNHVIGDLVRPHPFAAERAGFIGCKVSRSREGILILGHTYMTLQDNWYTDDQRYGCFFNADAMRAAMQFALTNDASMFHVHMHEHMGLPWFSRIDLRESSKFVPDFWNVRPNLPHGTLVVSKDSAAGLCWYPSENKPNRISRITAVGFPMKFLERLT
ncbi:MAG: hypothetical protein DMG39_12450 [Acidobacteria bacterium]|nr:MAG: hypothetical protein DMG39_12450 [Acidobacteriota bacterium]